MDNAHNTYNFTLATDPTTKTYWNTTPLQWKAMEDTIACEEARDAFRLLLAEVCPEYEDPADETTHLDIGAHAEMLSQMVRYSHTDCCGVTETGHLVCYDDKVPYLGECDVPESLK